MRTAIHPNLTVSHIQYVMNSRHPLDGLGPKSVLGLPMSVPVEQVSRVGHVVHADDASEDVACRCYGLTEPTPVVETTVEQNDEVIISIVAAPKEVVLLAVGGVGNMLDLFA